MSLPVAGMESQQSSDGDTQFITLTPNDKLAYSRANRMKWRGIVISLPLLGIRLRTFQTSLLATYRNPRFSRDILEM
jgi:hypothetical protein